jgi:hypothetical protein
MKNSMRIALVLALLLVGGAALAQSGGDYDLSWSTVDGGGGTSTGGDYALSGTAGQCDAGVLTGGEYTLIGGFWGGASTIYEVMIPMAVRN